MKYVVILGDGMAGYPLADRENRTCMQIARTPFFDELAKKSTVGLVRTVPTDFAPAAMSPISPSWDMTPNNSIRDVRRLRRHPSGSRSPIPT